MSTAKTDDLYRVLGVSRTASKDDIRRAYKRLALKYHPDKNSPSDRAVAEEHFKAVSKAYEVLANDDARQRYDRGDDILPRGTDGNASGADRREERWRNQPREEPHQRHRFPTRPNVPASPPAEDYFTSPSFASGPWMHGFRFSDPFELFNRMFAVIEDEIDRAFCGGMGFPFASFGHTRPLIDGPRRMREDHHMSLMRPFGGSLFSDFFEGVDPFDAAFDAHNGGGGGARSFSSHTVISNGKAKTVSVSRYTDRDGRVHEERHETEGEMPLNGGGRTYRRSLPTADDQFHTTFDLPDRHRSAEPIPTTQAHRRSHSSVRPMITSGDDGFSHPIGARRVPVPSAYSRY